MRRKRSHLTYDVVEAARVMAKAGINNSGIAATLNLGRSTVCKLRNCNFDFKTYRDFTKKLEEKYKQERLHSHELKEVPHVGTLKKHDLSPKEVEQRLDEIDRHMKMLYEKQSIMIELLRKIDAQLPEKKTGLFSKVHI